VGSVLWGIAGLLVVLWLVGFFVAHLAGALIHLLLVLAVLVIGYKVLTGRGRDTLT
jgi:hypothetical protein